MRSGVIAINPVAFRLGPINVYWYGLIIAAAVVTGLAVAKRLGRKFNFSPSLFDDFLFVALPLALVGSRLWYVVFNWQWFEADLRRIVSIWEGGLAIHGAVVVAIIIAWFFARTKKINFLRFVDICAAPLILGQAIGRWANYVNQEAYGPPTNLPWAMYIDGAYRHPTFLYESLWNLLVFFVLWRLLRKKPAPGKVFALYLVGYSIGRFFIEGLRTDSLMIGPFRTAQVTSLVFIAVGIGIYASAYYIRKGIHKDEGIED
jgi:phosphatidylglycerol:prolipoprotein diacylglycerol transferase